jgi:hypothetical protein
MADPTYRGVAMNANILLHILQADPYSEAELAAYAELGALAQRWARRDAARKIMRRAVAVIGVRL